MLSRPGPFSRSVRGRSRLCGPACHVGISQIPNSDSGTDRGQNPHPRGQGSVLTPLTGLERNHLPDGTAVSAGSGVSSRTGTAGCRLKEQNSALSGLLRRWISDPRTPSLRALCQGVGAVNWSGRGHTEEFFPASRESGFCFVLHPKICRHAGSHVCGPLVDLFRLLWHAGMGDLHFLFQHNCYKAVPLY